MVLERGITLVGVSVGNLGDDAAVQLALPFTESRPATHDPAGADPARESALDAALDGVRDRFGSAAVTRGALLRHGEGMEVPLLPD
jgi:DNA polymerase-4